MGLMAAGVMAAGALAGGLAGSQKQGGGTQTTTRNPWDPQATQLKYGFDQARSIYDNAKGTPWYDGELHAGLNPTQTGALSALNGYASGTGNDVATALRTNGMSSLGYVPQAGSNAQALFDLARRDPTQSNIDAATAYANNPAVNGMIDAANRDTVRELTESALPQNSLNAAATGNTNSSRTAMMDAILTRGAQDRMADTSANIRGQMFQNGLNLAEAARTANMNGALSANGQVANVGALGGQLAGQGYSTDVNNLNIPLQTGGIQQQDQQAQDQANFQQWQGNDTRANDLLSRYWNIVASNNWGGTDQTQLPKYGGGIGGALTGAIGGASMGAGIMSGFGGGVGTIPGMSATPMGPAAGWTALPSTGPLPWR